MTTNTSKERLIEILAEEILRDNNNIYTLPTLKKRIVNNTLPDIRPLETLAAMQRVAEEKDEEIKHLEFFNRVHIKDLQETSQQLQAARQEVERLKIMVANGLGDSDMQNDITYPR